MINFFFMGPNMPIPSDGTTSSHNIKEDGITIFKFKTSEAKSDKKTK
jgi:hypothetical protein